MLVLSRHLGESIILTLPDGSRVRVKYHEYVGGGGRHKVRLAIDAPSGVTVLREEIDTPEARARMAAKRPHNAGKSLQGGVGE